MFVFRMFNDAKGKRKVDGRDEKIRDWRRRRKEHPQKNSQDFL